MLTVVYIRNNINGINELTPKYLAEGRAKYHVSRNYRCILPKNILPSAG